ncbi:acyl-CoA dehydrogenase [Actinomadura sp. NBRC 104412]|uniref:acyl-CoA dehydrogenase family protein n=1 Tax=Actinomadura sp. NBRC 104412 TaxID=3032203 RepID=UPI0024A290C5|nr:acyl-CoA dehydrogenase family protein [Actinomadura sp. NBRC 104412]GLZ07505.1 acyl-CoA dehydrogenase [Actinomadura sp. NBRC 104412]
MRYLDEHVPDTLLGPAELELRERLRTVLASEVAPRAAEVDAAGAFAGPSYQALARAGLARLLFRPEHGGTGHGTVAYAMAVAEIAAVCASTSLIYMTQTHAAFPILVAGTEAQRHEYLPSLCSGERYGSLAITEPEAGSDVAALRTVAYRDGAGYLLDGAKTFITTGDRADVIVCFATVDPAAGRDGLTAFIVEGDAPGLRRGRVLDKLGMHGSTTAELFLDGVRVPAGALLGREGGGWELSMRSVVKSRISAAAQGVGIATGAYLAGLDRLHAGGRPPQRVAFALAELRTAIAAARLLLYATAAAADRADAPDLVAEVAMLKLACTDLGVHVADTMTGLLGGAGDLTGTGVEHRLRDAVVTQIYDGTNNVQRLLVDRDTRKRLSPVLAGGSEGSSPERREAS